MKDIVDYIFESAQGVGPEEADVIVEELDDFVLIKWETSDWEYSRRISKIFLVTAFCPEEIVKCELEYADRVMRPTLYEKLNSLQSPNAC